MASLVCATSTNGNDESESVTLATSAPKRKRCGYYCAVAECKNRHADGFTLHKFPTEPERRKQWIKFVATRRVDFGPKYGTPTQNSRVCADHFTPDSYEANVSLMRSFSMKAVPRLKATAVPTIHKPLSTNNTGTDTVSHTRCIVSRPTDTTPLFTCVTSSAVTACVGTVTVHEPRVSKLRGAYVKRQRKRIIDEALVSADISDKLASECSSDDPVHTESLTVTVDQAIQTSSGCHCQYMELTRMLGLQKQHKVSKMSKKVQITPEMAHKGTQVAMDSRPSVSQKATQCDLDLDTSYIPCNIQNEDEAPPLEPEAPEDHTDHDFVPDEESDTIPDEEMESLPVSTPGTERKFLVFETQLLELFENCSRCAAPVIATIQEPNGSLIRVIQECPHCKFLRTWVSQPFLRDVPAGNLLMSASILFSGSLPSKTLRFLTFMGVAAISTDTFFDHQRAFLHPAIRKEWNAFQVDYTRSKQGQMLTVGGDGRADSPGHCAKYGTYTLLDLDSMMVADVQIIQSNEVGGSSHMEKAGLMKSVQFIKDSGLNIQEIVTDRHPMIIKWVREELKDVKHSIDVWHVAKGMKKKLMKISNQKDCGDLSAWIKSMINHLYWVAISTPEADGTLMLEKWLSLSNHVHNIHHHQGDKFRACLHGPLEGRERHKKWFKSGTKLSVLVNEVLESRQMHKDIPMLSTGPQTAAIEGFHSVLNHFVPKMIGFSYFGMLYRNYLAALHFNENNNREQATTMCGDNRWVVNFKKATKGFCLREVRVDCTYMYVERLMEHVINLASMYSMKDMECILAQQQQAPKPLCAEFEDKRPSKAEAIQQHQTRFKLT